MRISDWSSDVCSSDLARVERDFVAAGSFSLDARVLIEPNAVPQDDIKAPPRVLAQRTGLARLAYWLVQDRIAVHTARLFHLLVALDGHALQNPPREIDRRDLALEVPRVVAEPIDVAGPVRLQPSEHVRADVSAVLPQV